MGWGCRLHRGGVHCLNDVVHDLNCGEKKMMMMCGVGETNVVAVVVVVDKDTVHPEDCSMKIGSEIELLIVEEDQ